MSFLCPPLGGAQFFPYGDPKAADGMVSVYVKLLSLVKGVSMAKITGKKDRLKDRQPKTSMRRNMHFALSEYKTNLPSSSAFMHIYIYIKEKSGYPKGGTSYFCVRWVSGVKYLITPCLCVV